MNDPTVHIDEVLDTLEWAENFCHARHKVITQAGGRDKQRQAFVEAREAMVAMAERFYRVVKLLDGENSTKAKPDDQDP